MNSHKKKKRLTHPSKGWPFPEMFLKTERLKTLSLYFSTASLSLFCLLTLVPHCFSPSDSVKELGIQTPTRWLLWDISLPSSRSAGFPNKVLFLALPHLSDSLTCCGANRVSLDSVTLILCVEQSDSVIHVHISILFQIDFPIRFLQRIEQSSLCYTVVPCWLSILKLPIFLPTLTLSFQ